MKEIYCGGRLLGYFFHIPIYGTNTKGKNYFENCFKISQNFSLLPLLLLGLE